MKKYILMLAVAAAATLVACGNKEQATEEVVEAPEVEAVEEVADSAAEAEADTTVVVEVAEEVAE